MNMRSTLTRLARFVATNIQSGRLRENIGDALHVLDGQPALLLDLIALMEKEARKKRPSDALISAYAYLLAHGLEQLRFGVESQDPSSLTWAKRLRATLLEDAGNGDISAPVLLLVLKQFAGAKLEIGDGLREAVQELALRDMENQKNQLDIDDENPFTEIVKQLNGDVFAIHEMLHENAETVPEDMRDRIVMATFGDKEPALREAALGFLLNGSKLTRSKLIEMIELAAPHGLVSPVMLRRVIAMRHLLPKNDHKKLEKAIKACRKAKVTYASWPRSTLRQVLASGIDGAGALTILAIIEDAKGKLAFAGILMKQGIGIRDAWVRRDVTEAELSELINHITDTIEIAPSTVDYAEIMIRHFLNVNADSGVMPPFILMQFAEAVGLKELKPVRQPVDDLIVDLCNGIDRKQLSKTAINRALRESANWPDDYPALETWFEDNITKTVGTKPGQRKKQINVLLAGPLQSRRRRYAEMIAWTALWLKHQPDNSDWQSFAIVARELLGERSLKEFGIMQVVADISLTVSEIQGLSGFSDAA